MGAFMLPVVGPALAKIGMGSQLGGLINLTGAVGAASMVPMMFGAGQPSEEDQERMLRRQLEIQDEFEQQRAQRMGGVPGQGMPMEDQLLSSLIFEEQMMNDAAMGTIGRDAAFSSINNRNDELMGLLSGYESKVAALQDERFLTPAELVMMLEGRGVR